jgi:hypothetical protein
MTNSQTVAKFFPDMDENWKAIESERPVTALGSKVKCAAPTRYLFHAMFTALHGNSKGTQLVTMMQLQRQTD